MQCAVAQVPIFLGRAVRVCDTFAKVVSANAISVLTLVVFCAWIAVFALFRDAPVEASSARVAYVQRAWICVITIDFNALAFAICALIVRRAATGVITGLIIGFILATHGGTAGVKGTDVVVVTVLGNSQAEPFLTSIVDRADLSIIAGGAVFEGGRDTLSRGRVAQVFNTRGVAGGIARNDRERVYHALKVETFEGAVTQVVIFRVFAIRVRDTLACVAVADAFTRLACVCFGTWVSVLAREAVVRGCALALSIF